MDVLPLESNPADSVRKEHQASPGLNVPLVSFLVVFSDADDDAQTVLRHYKDHQVLQRWPSELVIVNNGLGSRVNEEIRSILDETGIAWTVVEIHSTSNESTAFSEGLRATKGDVIVTLPPYLQVAPADIEPMVQKILDDELDFVASWRHDRVDSEKDAWKSRVFNWLSARLSSHQLHDINSTLRAIKREIVDDVTIYGDLHRFWPILCANRGYRVGEVRVRHLSEKIRRGDHRLGAYFRRLLDLLSLFFLTRFTNKPLRFFGPLGASTLALGFVVGAVILFQRFVLDNKLGDRPALVVTMLLIVLGVQLFSIGLLGELIIFTRSRAIKDYAIARTFDSTQDRKSVAVTNETQSDRPRADSAKT